MILQGSALEACIANIKTEEGYRSLMYKDTTGNWTVGYGHNLSKVGLSQAVCDQILREDLAQTEAELAKVYPYYNYLDDARKGILLDLCFNLGVVGLMQFKKMLGAIQSNNWKIAGNELMNSEAAKQEPHRIAKLSKALETGVF